MILYETGVPMRWLASKSGYTCHTLDRFMCFFLVIIMYTYAIQRGNAASVLGTIKMDSEEEEFLV